MNKEHTPERAVFEIQYSTRAESYYANRTCWVLTWDAVDFHPAACECHSDGAS